MDTIFIVIFIFISLVIGYVSTTGFKSQWVRLGDIFLLGPLMIWVGVKEIKGDKSNDWIRLGLIFFGATTISYNLKNYIIQN